ncbi:MAG TPA: hypothetical protein VK753_08890 [Xanthomonadaceae bacterium]|jgi:hypothetical protein|nr:hypothetical protein [Xanthomonadaceae bacterium]
MRMQVSVLLATPLLLLLLATSCAAHPAKPKACDLLSPQTATALLGVAVGEPTDMNGVVCTYLSTQGNATIVLGIADAPGADGANAIRSLQAVSSQQPGTTTKSIQGLGEQSFLVTRTSNKNAIMLVYHQKMLTLAVQKPMTPELENAMVQTLQQVLAKL